MRRTTGVGLGRPFGSGEQLGLRLRNGVRRLGLDPGDRGADFYRLALDRENLDQDARSRRRYVGIDLIGGDLEDRLVALDFVAHVLEPFRNGPLGDRLAHLGHDDIDSSHYTASLIVEHPA
jgi:hypothetical protein